ncbi:glycosyltransferase family A protein [Rhizobium sp. 007]|uniref:glycosyltransferase family 2 protein n=1 Tax=Rhizobium sp. 007 TaxID=2785056 RepID=UPI00188F48B2|nr:glycosyltransferase family A protein [Rhizobium sp. 007]QPB22380.1 glycosyltransferase family 2 protein [Rhizobium sp. 007]
MHISVVIPVKNRSTVIHRAVESALTQTLPPIEVIVVDDGSTDETPQVVERIAESNPRVRLIREKNSRGAPRARNAGALETRGEAIAFLDSDDCWKPTKLQRQAALLNAYPETPAVYTGFEFYYPSVPMRSSKTPVLVERKDLYGRNVLGGTSSAVVRRSAFDETGGFAPDMPACQDWEFWLRLAKLGPLRSDPAPLVEYHFDGNTRISKNRANVEAGHQRIFQIVNDSISDPLELRKVKALQAIRLAEVYAKQCYDPIASLGNASKAVFLDLRPRIVYMALKATANVVAFAFSK